MPTFYTATDKRCKTSQMELDALEALGAALAPHGMELVPQVKIGPWVFDAGVQDSYILIELNGTYWHEMDEVRDRDRRKSEWAERADYTIVTIHEAAWKEDRERAIANAVAHILEVKEAQKLTVEKRRNTGSGDWMGVFVEAVEAHGNISKAAKAAGISRAIAYERRGEDADFAKMWDAALACYIDELRETAERRAREQSDTLLMFVLKKHDPSYRDSGHMLNLNVDMTNLPDDLLEAIASGRVGTADLARLATQSAGGAGAPPTGA